MRGGLVGAGDPRFSGIVRHLLRGLGLRAGPGRAREAGPDLVLVAVERGQVNRRLAAARDRARGAPVVAVLRSSDVELANLALAGGAHAFYALDTSFEYLRDTVLTLLGLHAAGERRTAAKRPGRGRASWSLRRAVSASPAPV